MVKLKDLRKKALSELKLCENDSPLADIDYILKGLGFNKTDIILGEKCVDDQAENQFKSALRRLKKGEPVQYIVGECEFMSHKFEVNSATLIPRSDTEILVETVCEFCRHKKNIKILEIGSGSGCIAVSLACFLPEASVVSLDVSQDAVLCAGRNAKKNKVEDRVTFVNHNIMEGFPDLEYLPDVVVSNPPYIPRDDIEKLDKKVREFEPQLALDGGEDGLDFYRFITKNANIKKGGLLALEVGINQAQDVKTLMEERFSDIQIIKDLSGIERVVMGIA